MQKSVRQTGSHHFFCSKSTNQISVPKEEKKGGLRFTAVYSVLFLICAAVIFLPFIVSRRTLINYADGFNQYYPVFIYIGRYLRSLIPTLLETGQIPMFDFSIGFGDDIIGTLNYYGFGSPFTLLSALFPASYAALGYSLVIVLKFYVAGWSFSWFCGGRRIPKRNRLAGMIAYAFSGYALYYGTMFPLFGEAMITLPLFAGGIEAMIRGERKRSTSVIWAVFLQAISGFYFLYMISLFGVLYYFVEYGCSRRNRVRPEATDKDRRGRFARHHPMLSQIGLLLGEYAVGICMSGVILLPSIYAYLHSTRSGSSSLLEQLTELPTFESVFDTISGLFYSDSETGIALPIVFAVCLAMLIFRRGHRDLKILFGILFLGYLIPGFGSLMNGFSYSTDRWKFLLYFLAAVILAEGLNDLSAKAESGKTAQVSARVEKEEPGWNTQISIGVCSGRMQDGRAQEGGIEVGGDRAGHLSRREIILSTVIMAVWLAAAVISVWGDADELKIVLIYLLGLAVIGVLLIAGLLPLQRLADKCPGVCENRGGNSFRQPAAFLSCFLVLNVALIGFHFNLGGGYGVDHAAHHFRSTSDTLSTIESSGFAGAAWREEEEGLARIDVYDTSLDASLAIGAYSTTSYYSISNEYLFEFYKNALISTGIRGGTYALRGLDGRLSLEMLTQVTQYDETQDGSAVTENAYYLPLGVVYEKTTTAEEVSSLHPLSISSLMSDTLILNTAEADTGADSDEEPVDAEASESVDEETDGSAELQEQYTEHSFTVELTGVEWDGETLTAEAGGTIRIIPEDEEDVIFSGKREYYLYLDDFSYEETEDVETNVEICGKTLCLRGFGNRDILGDDWDTYLVKLNDTQEEGIVLTFPEAGNFRLGTLQLLSIDISDYDEIYGTLSASAMTDTEISANRVSGTVTLKDKGYLFFSIPYSAGWTCWVDGEKTELVRTDYAFMSVALEAGEYEIVLTYMSPWMVPGIALTVLGWVAAAVIFGRTRNKRRRREMQSQ